MCSWIFNISKDGDLPDSLSFCPTVWPPRSKEHFSLANQNFPCYSLHLFPHIFLLSISTKTDSIFPITRHEERNIPMDSPLIFPFFLHKKPTQLSQSVICYTALCSPGLDWRQFVKVCNSKLDTELQIWSHKCWKRVSIAFDSFIYIIFIALCMYTL